ncbi:sigma-70 family RNA polymerase sigma factor [Mucilaginibacter sp. SMC90]|uniref:RNA polymerase sigma factor n=1 Tax=Mucilaginibacter sp. SMC90 TaxID=2929803 RepID=UPI001FB2BADB|nr:sigma-70 family RNA polymerase sigma factor [Mucilaginibacter sp. SMC90]UOE51941.1 sigma-70 family RNA polymerase sigma factor [Mucilaginibacter sp. SMC90]
MMQQDQLLPHLFRSEYQKIIAVLCHYFGFEHIEAAEDIASDTFLTAAETWGIRGLPDNPKAWLYTVARNKATDYVRRGSKFKQKIAEGFATENDCDDTQIDLSDQNISDSQLQMMFAICHPSLSAEAQIGLALRILCGFGIDEIAEAFLSNKETINKRLFRAKEKLREQKVKIVFPEPADIVNRLGIVLKTLYLLFNEGYYSSCQSATLRKDLCLEAMRLNYLLVENKQTNLPEVNALLSLMCFHASRFDARIDDNGEMIRYDDQDRKLWNDELIAKGKHYLNLASKGSEAGKYHIEAAIAYWHTVKTDNAEKWENILMLYNRLLIAAYSPAAALNRAYALAKVRGKEKAIIEAEKLKLDSNHLYHVLLGYLYTDVDNEKAVSHLKLALKLAKTPGDRSRIGKDLDSLLSNDCK